VPRTAAAELERALVFNLELFDLAPTPAACLLKHSHLLRAQRAQLIF
jgi:hypothetical protein